MNYVVEQSTTVSLQSKAVTSFFSFVVSSYFSLPHCGWCEWTTGDFRSSQG